MLSAGAAALVLTLSACAGGGIEGGGGQTGFITGSDGIATVKKGDRDTAPDLSGKTIDGDRLDLSAYKGKIIVLNVWGSWCAPCRAEAPNLVKVSQDLAGRGVQFVGINTRDTSTRPALAFEEQYKVTYPSLYDPTGKLLLRFEKGSLNPQLIPSTLVIDREGKLAVRTQQPLSEEKLRKMLKPILAEK
ncbi:TlpA family protein disulfide reductase [Streptomyces sp. LBUM 1478]|uniref:Putative secreted redoxin n=1 Tax=Streptomyces scabiei (strain 87.22) TaxID=680198 RepID=C9YZ84_STRSW|nr:TlpA family protein disulfide reductase [Streptomyces sp. LBUM 1485]MBP5907592.1 TlpA family protein disulfide reductase [Streptomyces sp. LBUM 1478]MBP5914961.1 TlpA family protein disulfide reductase [Streptomyces sp. LBUM 1486]MBP5929499.1 TlpA family protein disulfide reductase [Streptomyces sp. LBUM 1479]QTU59248.1 TlpA family protein disulfide reductase [Streptomyces sp. LBUM 1480]CBG70947.1 putative secreted redoxin [Streptomyces scabiei 87.22]